jgi:hypothetical protein
MKIRDLLGGQAARDLLVGNGSEDNGTVLEPGARAAGGRPR